MVSGVGAWELPPCRRNIAGCTIIPRVSCPAAAKSALPADVRASVEGVFRLQFGNQLLIFFAQILGNDDFDDGVLVPFFSAALDASPFDAELRAAAGAGRSGKG